MQTLTLYRPVNRAELDLVAQSGWTAFPPRLPEQPIFYPVMNEAYARQIALDWNVPAYGEGFVLRFDVDASFASRYEVQNVGAKIHDELWVPAEELAEFNAHIRGRIELIASYPEH